MFFLSAAEHSGDALGAAVIPALRSRFPDAQFVGVGGEAMARAGCRLLANPTVHSAMLLGAASQAFYWYRLLGKIKAEFSANRPAVVMPIDSPAIHLKLAKMAKQAGLPVCYYVAPQLWAWGAWRMKKLADACDTVCCVLPFEEEYFRRFSVHAVYVGHPMFDVPADDLGGDAPAAPLAPIEPPLPTSGAKMALLPGSRSAEIDGNLPVMLRVITEANGRLGKCSFVIAAASEARAWQIRRHLRHFNLPVDIRVGMTDAVIQWADVVLVVSGTATLQVAKHGKAMIVMYYLAPWKWLPVGQFLVKTRYRALVNILAGRRVAPEYIPFYGSPAPLARDAVALLSQPQLREDMGAQLREVVSALGPGPDGRSAAARVAAEVAKLVGTPDELADNETE